MTQVVVEVNSTGDLVLPKKVVEAPAGTRMSVHKNKDRILVRLEEQPKDEQGLNIAQWLETLKANVINGVLAAEIEPYFQSLSTSWFDTGIIRACQQAAILAVSRLFDTHKDSTTLPKFLDFAELHNHAFSSATPEQVNQAISDHREWISGNRVIPAVRNFRNTQWGHTDTEALKSYFTGLPDGVQSTGFEMSEVYDVLEQTRKMVNIYSQFLEGQSLDLSNLREEITRKGSDYARFRLQTRTTSA